MELVFCWCFSHSWFGLLRSPEVIRMEQSPSSSLIVWKQSKNIKTFLLLGLGYNDGAHNQYVSWGTIFSFRCVHPAIEVCQDSWILGLSLNGLLSKFTVQSMDAVFCWGGAKILMLIFVVIFIFDIAVVPIELFKVSSLEKGGNYLDTVFSRCSNMKFGCRKTKTNGRDPWWHCFA